MSVTIGNARLTPITGLSGLFSSTVILPWSLLISATAFACSESTSAARSEAIAASEKQDSFAEADVVFANDDDFAEAGNRPFRDFRGKVSGYVDLVTNPLSRRQPTLPESLMATAYAISRRSSCLQRKVGAVIVDEEGNIISSGFNEIPREDRPCVEEYGKCGRARGWEQSQRLLREEFPQSAKNQQALLDRVRREFRMLDHCRALHAEENAIVNLARNGRSVPLEQCKLYCTTYPCRQCANKIVNLGIRHVVYCEPYPDEEAKAILKAGNVRDEFFEGITFKAYSRIYGERK
jgi:deoxycytidylate deaminase